MKSVLTIATLFIAFSQALAVQVKLKITYKGSGVADHTVTVSVGGAALGSGVTDNDGNVSINVSSLPTKQIDLKGEKTCENAQKKWDVKGMVTLDDNNFAELKMEEVIKMISEGSGGMMSENMLATSYGLVCKGSSSSSNGGGTSTGGTSSTNTGTNSTNTGTNNSTLPTREESLATQKTNLELKLDGINRKIEKKSEKLNELQGEKKRDAEYDIKELEIEKKQTQNKLDKVNLQIEKGLLNKEERNRFSEKDDALDEEMKKLKEERKNKGGNNTVNDKTEKINTITDSTKKDENIKVENTKTEDTDDLTFTEERFATMSNIDLSKKKMNFNSEISKLKLKLKTKKNSMSPNEVKETEERIAKLEAAVVAIEAEQKRRDENK